MRWVSASELLDRLLDLEKDVLYREPALDATSRIGRVSGSVPVLLSAPHGAIHTRGGQLKEEEEFTAALACYVAHVTDANALYARRQSPTDPNFYREVPYKGQLSAIADEVPLRFVLDLHGMAPDRPVGLALGTMEGESCPDHRGRILEYLRAQGFRSDAPFPDRLDVDQTFTAIGVGEQETITSFVSQRLGVPAAQVELHPLLRVVERREDASLPRPFCGDPNRISRVVQALVHMVEEFGARAVATDSALGDG